MNIPQNHVIIFKQLYDYFKMKWSDWQKTLWYESHIASATHGSRAEDIIVEYVPGMMSVGFTIASAIQYLFTWLTRLLTIHQLYTVQFHEAHVIRMLKSTRKGREPLKLYLLMDLSFWCLLLIYILGEVMFSLPILKNLHLDNWNWSNGILHLMTYLNQA